MGMMPDAGWDIPPTCDVAIKMGFLTDDVEDDRCYAKCIDAALYRAPVLYTFESLNMSMLQIFYVALFIVFFSCLRFGVPALLLWALGRLAARHGLQEPRVPISR